MAKPANGNVKTDQDVEQNVINGMYISLQEPEMAKLTGQLESIRTELHSAQQELHSARTQLQGVERERDDMAGKLAAWEKRSSSLSGGHPEPILILRMCNNICHGLEAVSQKRGGGGALGWAPKGSAIAVFLLSHAWKAIGISCCGVKALRSRAEEIQECKDWPMGAAPLKHLWWTGRTGNGLCPTSHMLNASCATEEAPVSKGFASLIARVRPTQSAILNGPVMAWTWPGMARWDFFGVTPPVGGSCWLISCSTARMPSA